MTDLPTEETGVRLDFDDSPAGLVCTFYSYKGGVGRSMALANTAAILAKWGKRVLVVDWDLEAPGIEKYFDRWIPLSRAKVPGLVDMVHSVISPPLVDWRQCLLSAAIPNARTIDIISAGRDDENYVPRLRQINWEQLFEKGNFGLFVERLRYEWSRSYDYVLIDSRTGITDIGGICTIQLPDVLLSFFTANQQSLRGVKDVMARVRKAHRDLPVDRTRLLMVPIPSRDESLSEYKRAKEWRERFARELAEFYQDWIPQGEDPVKVLDILKIPYFPYWSFGEPLTVVEEDPDNPKTLTYSYQLIGRLLLGRLSWTEVTRGALSAKAEQSTQVALSEDRARAEKAREEALRATAERDRSARLKEEEDARLQFEKFMRVRFAPARKAIVLKRAAYLLFCAVCTVAAIIGGVNSSQYNYDARVFVIDRPVVVVSVAFLAAAAASLWGLRRSQRLLRFLEDESQRYQTSIADYRGLALSAALVQFQERIERSLRDGKAGSLREPMRSVEKEAPTNPTAEAERVATGAIDPSTHFGAQDSQSAAMQLLDVDVFLSWRASPIVEGWMREFEPLLSAWLVEAVGHDVRLFTSGKDASGASRSEGYLQALESAGCLVAVITPSYVADESLMEDWLVFRKLSSRPIFGVMLDRASIDSRFPQPEIFDFSEYAFVGEGFSKSPRYVEFQSQVRKLAAKVGESLRAQHVTSA